MNDDEVEPSRLLSRKRGPSISEKDQMFDAIASRVAVPRRRVVPWMLALPAAALLGGLVFALRAGDLGRSRAPQPDAPPVDGEFVPRGAMRVVEVACTPAPCVRGSRMHMRINTPGDQPNAALFSQASDGTIVWYLPSPGGVMFVPPRGEWLPDAVVLGDEHRPGRYTLYVALSALPLSRDELKAELGDGLRSTPNVTLVKSTLKVEAGP